MTSEKTVWELLESPPHGCDETASLYSWSLNYDAGKGPMTLFLDLIGWSEDNFGDPLYTLKDASLGNVELNHLADALKEYALNPHSVGAFVDELMAAEGRD